MKMHPEIEQFSQEYNEIMVRYFAKRAQEYSINFVDRVGWSSRKTQNARFKTIARIGNMQNRSILDVGCGVGDFYAFLTENEIFVNYTGIDLVSKNCIDATKKFNSAKFLNVGLNEFNPKEKFDYVVASGIFFLRYENWNYVIEQALEKMFMMCKIGLAVNFLSAYSEPEDEISKHVYPNEVLDMTIKFSKIFNVFHDYAKKSNDFTLFIYRVFPNHE